jgi:hypothetical protein
MSNNEAKTLLENCIPLLEKTKVKRSDFHLTKKDRIALEGYRQVFQSGLTEDRNLRQQVGFSSSDLAELSFLLLKQSGKKYLLQSPRFFE